MMTWLSPYSERRNVSMPPVREIGKRVRLRDFVQRAKRVTTGNEPLCLIECRQQTPPAPKFEGSARQGPWRKSRHPKILRDWQDHLTCSPSTTNLGETPPPQLVDATSPPAPTSPVWLAQNRVNCAAVYRLLVFAFDSSWPSSDLPIDLRRAFLQFLSTRACPMDLIFHPVAKARNN
jgi:hypothetical protein